MGTAEGSVLNTLRYRPDLCAGCGVCVDVCPHGVFAMAGRAVLQRPNECIECGACTRNCPTGAIQVDAGVGCAQALLRTAFGGGEAACQGDADC